MEPEQRWLSLDGICTSLRLEVKHVRILAKKGYLVSIGGKGDVPIRYLDPTPEYREKLRLAAVIHMGAFPVKADITEKFLVSTGEIGQILGKNSMRTNRWLTKHHIKGFKINRQFSLYSVKDVREAFWKRKDRKVSKQRAPFLIPEIVEFLQNNIEAETSILPTDKEFRQDDVIHKKLAKLIAIGDSAKNDFSKKVALAKRIVQILDSTATVERKSSPSTAGRG